MSGLNRDDIIRMAREAGISKPWDQEPVKWETLERFANLVAAAEREAFDAKYPIQLTHDQYNVVINAALKDEREMCAKVAEEMGNIDGNMNKTWRNGCFDVAFAIRERGAP
jgi:hypothetical protein